MRYHWKDIPGLLRTPIGRSQLIFGIWHKSWPVLSRLAHLYRQTFFRNTRVVVIVGSFGKSTMLRTVLTALGREVNPNFDLNAYASIARRVLRTGSRDRHAIFEIGIDGCGQMAEYARMIRPDITVITSIGSEHNRSFGTLDVTRAETLRWGVFSLNQVSQY
jgi:UDP-N-acetylmuramoyl-tripeptide--D-alanyl-D-alanine ligase